MKLRKNWPAFVFKGILFWCSLPLFALFDPYHNEWFDRWLNWLLDE